MGHPSGSVGFDRSRSHRLFCPCRRQRLKMHFSAAHLKIQLKRQLQYTALVPERGNRSKSSWIGVRQIPARGVAELWVVQQVIRFRAELEISRLALERQVFEDR